MKILIISQHIFPRQTPRAHRTTELIKEFAKQGHEVTVYAVLGEYNYEVFEKTHNVSINNISIKTQLTPYTSDDTSTRSLVDKISGKLFGKLLEFPNIEFLYAIPKIIKKEENIDLLISIADPHHIHWGCAKSKLKNPTTFPKMWTADCGDPFMENGHTTSHFKCFAKYEKLFSGLCDYITVPHEGAIEGYYPEFRNKIKIIPQGFSFDLLEENKVFVENKVVTFAYAGMFLKDIRNPNLFLDYISSINIDFKFIVYTPYSELILPYKKRLGEKLEIREVVGRKELLEVLKGVDFLLNVENLNSPTAIPSKLIDYSISGRPILSINPENINKSNVDSFLKRDYSNKLVIQNLERFHISNVVKKFTKLSEA